MPVDQFAEVLVSSHQQSITGVGLAEDLVIRDSRRQLGNVKHIVAILPQTLHHLAVDTLVSHQIHADFTPTG